MADSVKQDKKQNFNWLKEYQWQKGQSGNPHGRPKGKTLKEFTREFLSNMSEEARFKFLKSVDADTVWKMAEGNPNDKVDITSKDERISTLPLEAIAIIEEDLRHKKTDEEPDKAVS